LFIYDKSKLDAFRPEIEALLNNAFPNLNAVERMGAGNTGVK
jgi:hypothetical protein